MGYVSIPASDEINTKIATHNALAQNVHGVGANDVQGANDIDTKISTHNTLAQNVHGVGGNDVQGANDMSTHAGLTQNVHGAGAYDILDANDLTGYSKVTSDAYTGNNTANRAIAHGLGVTPKYVFLMLTSGSVVRHFILINTTLTLSYNSADYRNTVTSWDATNFYVGKSANPEQAANSSSETYTWLAVA